ncbi:MAG: Mut7-C ubiquitin/RNAse domain-containing protein [Anaerolineae bacterium]|nr:Mut7-C ubiquitin/RNAse domain-containing protein [Anaerolineae bacterium]
MQATFRFYAGLNHFLPPEQRQVDVVHVHDERASVKDRIEALGVPHTEVALILVNGEPVDFSYLVDDGDRVSVYPPFHTLDITALNHVTPPPLPEARFVLDTHLGKLAAYLRLLGFDTLYRNDYPDDELARVSDEENRIVLTRDRGVLKRSRVRHGYYVRATDPRQQIVELLRHYGLFEAVRPFRRCMRCNGLLEPVEKAAVYDELLPGTREYHDEFYRCQDCGQLYWPGAHFEQLQAFIAGVLAQGA